jgi:hypothetical protein
MRALVASILALAALGATASDPKAAHACTGRVLELEDALRMSQGAVYAGHIVRSEPRLGSGYDITIEIDTVVRGPAAPRLRRASTGRACEPIFAGAWGYIVRDVKDPEYPEAVDDLFFRVNRYVGRNAVRAAGLPDTATGPEAPDAIRTDVPWGWLTVWATVFALTYRRLGQRRGMDS